MPLMPITVAQLRGYLRAESTIEDALLAELIAEGIALLETRLGRAVVGTGRTFGSSRGYRVHLSARIGGTGDAVYAGGGETLSALSDLPDYHDRLVPLVNRFVRAVAADVFQHRNPSATSDSTAGASVSYGDYELPPIAEGALNDLKRSLGG